jgi:hypothetical protein
MFRQLRDQGGFPWSRFVERSGIQEGIAKGKPIYVGLDVHKRQWVVTVLCQAEELYHGTVVPEPAALIRVLKRLQASEVHTVYEAGPTGYWLHDALAEAGFCAGGASAFG